MTTPSRNVRRFFRINMPLRCFVTPSAPIADREVFASGANYCPVSIRSQLNNDKKLLLKSLLQIQEHKDALTEIFNEMINHADFFGQCCEMLSKGINPRYNLSTWAAIKSHRQGFEKLKLLENVAPKTFRYLKNIEEKYLFYVQQLMDCSEHSTPEQFHAPDYLPDSFRADTLVQKLTDEKYQAIPLVQSILNTANFINTYTETFRQMHDDHVLRQNPADWPEEIVNVSASGLAIKMRKAFRLHERVKIQIYFPEMKRILKFDGVVVNVQSDAESQLERVAMNFEFPDGKSQNLLQTQIQRYEIRECLTL